MDVGRLVPASPVDLLLQRYGAAGVTGCLRIDQGELQARVYFRDGMVYTATAPGARARLGDRLVGAGHVSEDQLAATLDRQRILEEPRRIGELLIERGLIDRETMRTFVREQSTDSVAVTLGWREGSWTFTEGEQVPEDVPLDMSVENLLMEGARRLEEWEVILARIGSIDAIPDFVSGDQAADLALTPDEWSMLTRIDGRSSIAEIADDAGYSEFETGRIVYGLLSAGVLRLVEDPDDAADEGDDDEAAPDGEAREADDASAPFDPEVASGLFGELGLEEDDDQPAPAKQEELTPDQQDAQSALEQEQTTPAESEQSVEGEAPAGEAVNRNELLREFAALDEADDKGDDPPPAPPRRQAPPAPPRRQAPSSARGEEGDKTKDRRRGLFRRRRD